MTSLSRLIVPAALSISTATLWRAALGMLAVAAFIIARACEYDFGGLAAYFGYFVLYVALPGVVAMYAVQGRSLSIAHAIALGVPTGFAIEIFTYLGLLSLELKELYAWTPLGWSAAVIAIRCWRHVWPVRVQVSANHAGIAAGLCAAFLGTAVMAASQMFAESPLAGGLPTRAIFHDWVYLVSRAAVIKNNWPLDDPSLAGTPLQYHYYMMVHAAAASWTTGVELTAVMLRLLYVPLGATMVVQAYVLGRSVARTPWGGVVAAFLTVAVTELSFSTSYGEPMFLGLFVRWLFVSPTFFFGIIFCGALLIAVPRCARLERCDARHYIWLLLLGTAGTGAKGTVMPVLVCALGVWTLWRWIRERHFPLRPVLFGGCLTLAFLIVYIPTMSAWRTGDAALRPFHVFQLSAFWKAYFPAWQQWLGQWMPVNAAAAIAGTVCAAIVFMGTCGVRLLALFFLARGDLARRDALLVSWLGAFFVASVGMGVLLELNSFGELYVLLMMRLPLAVLTAGFLIAAWRRFLVWWNQPYATPAAATSRLPLTVRAAGTGKVWFRRTAIAAAGLVVLGGMSVQISLWWARNSSGLREFLKTPSDLQPDDYMQELQEALLWVRRNTEPNAVLVANSCTPENMKTDHWGKLDRTLMGVHFYYSALSERRMWFEGPNYVLDTTRARSRANIASNFFYRHKPLRSDTVSEDPTYVLLDRSLKDGAQVTLPPENRVFSNRRIEIYRLSSEVPGVKLAGSTQQ